MIVSHEEWQQFISTQPEAHILQSAEWGELKSHFGWEVVRVLSAGTGAQILFRKLPFGFRLAYLPRPLTSIFQPAELWQELDGICRAKRAVFLKVEPDVWQDSEKAAQLQETERKGFQHSSHNIQPPRTSLVDITGSEEETLARFKQKCRYNVRLAQKKGVAVRAWDDVSGFYKMILETGGRDGFGVHSLEYYRQAYQLFHSAKLAEILVAEYEGLPLAALMVFARGQRAYYLYGASTDRERNRMPAYLLQWEAMRWARMRGCSEYDLWGLPDEEEDALEAGFESRSDGLWGVYRFKRGFGGTVKRAAQALDRVYKPWLYFVYLKLMAGRG